MLMMNAYRRCSFLAVPLLAALGCSDPVPPPAQGAVTFTVGPPTMAVSAMSCPEGGHTYQVGAVDPKTMLDLAPTQNDPGQSVISGESGSSITCSVTGGKGNFNFSGSLHAATPHDGLITITFNGAINMMDTDGNPTGTASVSVFTPTSGSLSGNAPCTVTVLQGQIKGGSMWASFTCDQVSSPPSSLCGVAGYIVFENCSGS
jgi:hypothetical protein